MLRFLRVIAAGLGCVGLGCIVAAATAQAMDFTTVSYGDPAVCGSRCPLVISATGDISNDSAREFYEFLSSRVADRRLRSIVFLHSPGGAVVGAMKLGEMFRKTGVLTVVARILPAPPGVSPALFPPGARCFSACVYALMGGKKRVVPNDSLVGIHRMHFNRYMRDVGTGESTADRVYGSKDFVARLADYARSMGVSREIIYTAEQVAPDGLHIVTGGEMRKWRLGERKF